MKAVCISASLLFFSLSSLAQVDIFSHPVLPGIDFKNNFSTKESKQPGMIPLEFNLPESGIVKLPLDNMPCFVPDVSSLAVMPNNKSVSPYQSIPNPFFRYNTTPTGADENNSSLPK